MNQSHSNWKWNPARGVKCAALCALGGAAAPPFAFLTYQLLRWQWESAPARDRAQDMSMLPEQVFWPIIGCAVVCACAGWVTFAFNQSYRFAPSLLLIFAVSVPLWFGIKSLDLTPHRDKGDSHPPIYPSEVLFIVGPPILAAGLLTALRARGKTAQEKRPPDGATPVVA